MKNIKIIITLLLIGLLTVSCGNTTKNNNKKDNHSENKKDEHNHEHDDEHEEGTVLLTEQQSKAISLKLVNLENKKMNIAVKTTGSLEVAPHDKADVSSIIGGIVKNIYVIEGDKVKKGKILAKIEHPDIVQMQQDYINNINSFTFLEQEYNRKKTLYKEKIGSGKEYQKITSEYKNSKANLKAQKMKLKMLGLNVSEIEKGNLYPTINIVSPLNGKVSLVETNIGAYAEPLSKLFEIVNNDELHADVMIFEKDISKVKIGQKLKFTTGSIKNQEFTGIIHAISPVFEENPKAIHVHAEILNKNKTLIPGMFIQGQIMANDIMTTALPEESIVVENEKNYIFIKVENEKNNHDKHNDNHNHDDHNHDNHNHEHKAENNKEIKQTFKMVEVITGIKSNNFVEIKLLEKLPKNTKIVSKGAYFLLAEMRKSEAEHNH